MRFYPALPLHDPNYYFRRLLSVLSFNRSFLKITLPSFWLDPLVPKSHSLKTVNPGQHYCRPAATAKGWSLPVSFRPVQSGGRHLSNLLAPCRMWAFRVTRTLKGFARACEVRCEYAVCFVTRIFKRKTVIFQAVQWVLKGNRLYWFTIFGALNWTLIFQLLSALMFA